MACTNSTFQCSNNNLSQSKGLVKNKSKGDWGLSYITLIEHGVGVGFGWDVYMGYMTYLTYDIKSIFSTTYQKEEVKIKSYVATMVNICHMCLRLGHLYELKSSSFTSHICMF